MLNVYYIERAHRPRKKRVAGHIGRETTDATSADVMLHGLVKFYIICYVYVLKRLFLLKNKHQPLYFFQHLIIFFTINKTKKRSERVYLNIHCKGTTNYNTSLIFRQTTWNLKYAPLADVGKNLYTSWEFSYTLQLFSEK